MKRHRKELDKIAAARSVKMRLTGIKEPRSDKFVLIKRDVKLELKGAGGEVAQRKEIENIVESNNPKNICIVGDIVRKERAQEIKSK